MNANSLRSRLKKIGSTGQNDKFSEFFRKYLDLIAMTTGVISSADNPEKEKAEIEIKELFSRYPSEAVQLTVILDKIEQNNF